MTRLLTASLLLLSASTGSALAKPPSPEPDMHIIALQQESRAAVAEAAALEAQGHISELEKQIADLKAKYEPKSDQPATP